MAIVSPAADHPVASHCARPRAGRHAKPVLDDPNGGSALAVLGSIIAVSAILTELGNVAFGDIGAFVGGGIYVVASAVACTAMTIRDASNAGRR
ncbi:MAG TPA: hypothetical protein VFH38_08125 [Jatrophihabitans sp.]|nr:hypothetical protein [Jatrophihabitans sp.]